MQNVKHFHSLCKTAKKRERERESKCVHEFMNSFLVGVDGIMGLMWSVELGLRHLAGAGRG